MDDPIDQMIRQASQDQIGGPKPLAKRTRPAVMILIALAAIVLAVPVLLAVSHVERDDLWNLATGLPGAVILEDE